MSVLTEKGFHRPTYDELLVAQEKRARAMFGEDIDTSEQSVLGKFVRIQVQDLADCYELLEDIYYARFPGSATGQSLDRLCTFAGVVRDAATAARIQVRFTGSVGSVISAACMISGGDNTYYVDDDYTIGTDGMATVYANCTETGTVGNIASGTALSIVNPDPDLEAVELVEIVSYGQDRETDASLRTRFDKAIAGSGSASVDAISGAISRVPLVDGVAIVENDTEQTVDGRPAHSFECYVLAPESQDQLVAEAIFSKKPLGIKCVGNVEMQVLDNGNKAHTVRFSRTVEKTIWVNARILTNQFFENDGVEQIKDSLITYINNLANGESVYLSSLYGYIHDIHGVVNVQELKISTDGETYAADNVPVSEYEVARTAGTSIEIEVISL